MGVEWNTLKAIRLVFLFRISGTIPSYALASCGLQVSVSLGDPRSNLLRKASFSSKLRPASYGLLHLGKDLARPSTLHHAHFGAGFEILNVEVVSLSVDSHLVAGSPRPVRIVAPVHIECR